MEARPWRTQIQGQIRPILCSSTPFRAGRDSTERHSEMVESPGTVPRSPLEVSRPFWRSALVYSMPFAESTTGPTWPTMTVRNCASCAATRGTLVRNYNDLKLLLAAGPLDFMAMDLLGSLSKTVCGYRCIIINPFVSPPRGMLHGEVRPRELRGSVGSSVPVGCNSQRGRKHIAVVARSA